MTVLNDPTKASDVLVNNGTTEVFIYYEYSILLFNKMLLIIDFLIGLFFERRLLIFL